jgi:hypothetical protein
VDAELLGPPWGSKRRMTSTEKGKTRYRQPSSRKEKHSGIVYLPASKRNALSRSVPGASRRTSRSVILNTASGSRVLRVRAMAHHPAAHGPQAHRFAPTIYITDKHSTQLPQSSVFFFVKTEEFSHWFFILKIQILFFF